MSRQSLLRRLALVVSAIILVVAVPLSVNFIWLAGADVTASVAGAIVAIAGLVISVYGMVSSRSLFFVDPEEQKNLTAMQLIQVLGSIEKSSFQVFDEHQAELGAEPRRLPSRRIRDQMLHLGIWSEGDVIGFDELVHTRNRVIHGDLDAVSVQDLNKAMDKARQLRRKIPVPLKFDELT